MFDEAKKYAFVLKPANGKANDSILASVLLREFERFINGALEQIKRVERCRRSIQASMHPERARHRKPSMMRLFLDAHFYFICIGQVDKFLNQLCDVLDNPKLRKIQQGFQADFPREIRNHLEHLDERAVGRILSKYAPPELVSAWKNDHGNFRGGKFSFGGKQYPVNAEAAKKLKSSYNNVIAVIREDYALKDEHFVEREIRDKQIRTMTRWANKLLQAKKS